jgi:hypothetical protein
MNRIKKSLLVIIDLFIIALFSACKTIPQYHFTLNNTLAIFLLENKKGNYFCIPVQYMGDYHISNFVFVNGFITVGNYEILLNRDDLKITVYLNETADLGGSLVDGFTLIYEEENSRIMLSKIGDPLSLDTEPTGKYRHYYIFIEKSISGNDMKNMAAQYKNGGAYSRFGIEYDITIDGKLQRGSGLLDNFELYKGPAIDPVWLPPNLNYFKAKYLGK